MDIFVEVLEQDKENEKNKYRFKNRYVEISDHLEKVIPDFFTIRDPGLHAAIICASGDANVIPEQAFGKIIKENFRDVRLKFLSKETLSSQEPCGCIRFPIADGAGRALRNLEERIRNCSEEERITNIRAANEIERYALQEEDQVKDNIVSLEIIWNKWSAQKCSELLIRGPFYMPTIFALLVIPQRHFELFKMENVYFPNFIEYVVRGQDSDPLFNKLYKVNPELFRTEIQTAGSEIISNITPTIVYEDRISTEISQEKQGSEKRKELKKIKELEKRREILIQQKITSQEAHTVSTKDLAAAEKARTIHKEEK